MDENVITIDQLFKPLTFERDQYSSFLYTPFSSKLNRRVNLFTHNMYDLWVWLESDTDILKFNERAQTFPINSFDQRAINASPQAVTLHANKLITIHTIEADNQPSLTTGGSKANWEQWCAIYGFHHKKWSRESLKSNSIELANLKRLLRFTSAAGLSIDYSMESQVLIELENFRKITFYNLVQRLPSYDPEEVKVCIANLIVGKKIHSDIHTSEFSLITELSVHHEV